MKKQYLIYADESHRKGKYFNNFYGGAWKDPYRHWCLKSKNSVFGSQLAKKQTKKLHSSYINFSRIT